MSVTLVTPAGSRVLPTARVVEDRNEYHLRGERNPAGGATIPYGDRGRRPTPLVIEVDVQEASFPATTALVDAIIADAETAVTVRTPRGDRAVNALVEDSVRGRGPSVTIRLVFAPAGGYM